MIKEALEKQMQTKYEQDTKIKYKERIHDLEFIIQNLQ